MPKILIFSFYSLSPQEVKLTNHSFCFYWLVLFAIILARYFLIAGATYLFFYFILGDSFVKARGRMKYPLSQSICWDIELSILSGVFFALGAAFIMWEYSLKMTMLYSDLHKYGLWYLGFSFIAALILQDTYFYFIHRVFHHPVLFKWLHYGHHRSREPTPWTSFAFDLPEALLQVLFLVVLVFILPLHFSTLAILLMTMTVWAVLNHLGFQLLPLSSKGNWLKTWLIGPLHHSVHHRNYRVHYGLYFTFWDKLLGTQDPDYQSMSDYNQCEGVSSKGCTCSVVPKA
jgi:sterol desaturase/sphingolipid hydroxylase (fatty acid hydroxylase superfamily)